MRTLMRVHVCVCACVRVCVRACVRAHMGRANALCALGGAQASKVSAAVRAGWAREQLRGTRPPGGRARWWRCSAAARVRPVVDGVASHDVIISNAVHSLYHAGACLHGLIIVLQAERGPPVRFTECSCYEPHHYLFARSAFGTCPQPLSWGQWGLLLYIQNAQDAHGDYT